MRKLLADHGIAFDEVDIERTPGALDELVELTGSATHVPVLVVNDQVFVDFDDGIADAVLEAWGRSSAG